MKSVWVVLVAQEFTQLDILAKCKDVLDPAESWEDQNCLGIAISSGRY